MNFSFGLQWATDLLGSLNLWSNRGQADRFYVQGANLCQTPPLVVNNDHFLEIKASNLRIPDSYDAKIAKICKFWTLWPVI